MTIEKKEYGDSAELILKGWMDTQGAPQLAAAVDEIGPEIKSLSLDLSGLDYISSAGLRALLWAYKTFSDKCGFKLINVNEIVREVLDVTGFSDVLCIE